MKSSKAWKKAVEGVDFHSGPGRIFDGGLRGEG